MLATTTIAKSFGPVVALRSVQLSVAPGEVHALLGANGAGKSTLVKILTGVVRPDAGEILVRGQPVSLSSPADARRHGLAPVFQDPALVADLTVRENLRLTRADVRGVQAELERMGLAGLDLDEQVRDIPLPFLRMIDLARAVSFDPLVLLLDEITAALPPDLSEVVFAVMRRWRERDRSVLFISHRLAEVRAHCDMCTVLRDGREVASFNPAEGGEAQIVKAMLGEVAAAVTGPAAGAGRVRRRRRDASAGGPRAGRRTCARGRLPGGPRRRGARRRRARRPGSGPAVRHAVRKPAARRRRARRRRRATAQPPPLRRHPSRHRAGAERPAARAAAAASDPGEHRRAAVQPGPVLGIPQPAVGSGGPWTAPSTTRRSTPARRAQAKRLSGGNQQKLTIARWLATGFRTLLLFDPTRGIDVGTKQQIYDLVRELADGGAAIVMFTSELPEVALVCDRVIVLHGGRVVAELPAGASEADLLSAMHGLEVSA